MKRKNIISLMLLLAVFASCVTKVDPYVINREDYIYDIPDVEVTEDYVVGVMYNEINEDYWLEGYTGTPSLGQYDMKSDYHDRLGIFRSQLEYGQKAGIDFFIVDWNGRASDTLFYNYERAYREGYPKLVVKYNMAHLGSRTTDRVDDEPYFSEFLTEMDSLYRVLMKKNYYFVNEGKPVMVMGGAYRDRTQSLKYVMDAMYEKIGGRENVYSIGEGPQWVSPEMHADTIRNFNAFYEDRMLTDDWDRWYSYYSYVDLQYAYWQKYMKNLDKEFIPVVMPAYDADAYRIDNNYKLKREKDVYRTLANIAKRNIGSSRMVIINSWNNFREGSNLEPTNEISEKYLEYTKEFFKR